jgi:hypothetical protein
LFAAEFGLRRDYSTTAVKCEPVPPFGSTEWGIAVMNSGLMPALDVIIASIKQEIMWAEDTSWTPASLNAGNCIRSGCHQEESRLITRIPEHC